jgi:hypothetical protein
MRAVKCGQRCCTASSTAWREMAETVAEVELEDGEALLPERLQRVAEGLVPALGHAQLQGLEGAGHHESCPGAHIQLEGHFWKLQPLLTGPSEGCLPSSRALACCVERAAGRRE